MATAPVFRQAISALPPKFDLIPWCGPVKDQGDEGSCTGHAYSSVREFLARKYEDNGPILSPQFLYCAELIAEGTFPQDAGANSRTGCVILNQNGCCEEALFPYISSQIQHPTLAQMSNAQKYLGGAYHRITHLPDLLSCLSSGYVCTLGFTVYESFESDKIGNTGIMTMPKSHEKSIGGHEVFAVGYDLTTERVLIQNSWGSSWGQNGRFEMPFEFITDTNNVSDIWMCHLGRAWKTQG